MFRTKEWLAKVALFAMLAFAFALAGYVAAPRAATAQAPSQLQDCTLLYAVQPDDTLSSIARRFDTTTSRLVALNPIGNLDRIFPGLVLCVSTNNDVLLPDTGATAGVNALSVDPNISVTVRGTNFPANTRITVQMLPFGEQNPTTIGVDSFVTPQNGSFTRTFNIPQALQDAEQIRIRFTSGAVNITASTVFNNTSGNSGAINCSQYYTVRSGDALSEIANRFNTTVRRLVLLNDISDRSVIYRGQRLCVQAEDVIIPPTGANASFTVLSVDRNDDVTVRGQAFPAGSEFDVLIGEQNTALSQFITVADLTVPQDGMFIRTFDLPNEFNDVRNLQLRIEGVDNNLVVSRSFQNINTTTGRTDVFPVDQPVNLPDQPAAQATAGLTPGERITLPQGNAGAFLPESAYDGQLVVSRYETQYAQTNDLTFTQQLLDVRIAPQGGGQTDFVRGLVYAYFDITDTTRQQYNIEDLAIYHYDPQDQAWERCDIMAPVNDGGPSTDRLSCVLKNFGLYAMAVETGQ